VLRSAAVRAPRHSACATALPPSMAEPAADGEDCVRFGRARVLDRFQHTIARRVWSHAGIDAACRIPEAGAQQVEPGRLARSCAADDKHAPQSVFPEHVPQRINR
jgi:hypothetical protein